MSGLLDSQEGVVRRDQVVGTAITDAALRWLLGTRQWRAVLPSVFVTTGQPTDRQMLVAASLYAAPKCQVTGPAALRIHGIRSAPADDRIHLLIPEPRHLRSASSVVVLRTQRFDDAASEDGCVSTVSPARAVADTARLGHDLRTVRAFVTEVVQRRLARPQDVARELEEGPRRNSAVLRTAVNEVTEGIRSAPEAEFRAIVEDTAIIPRVLWNPLLRSAAGERLPTPDAWIEDAGIAIEVDSREYHSTPDGWARTLQRHNVLASHGVLVLHFTPAEIRSAPEMVRRRLVAAYLSRRSTPHDHRVVHVVRTT